MPERGVDPKFEKQRQKLQSKLGSKLRISEGAKGVFALKDIPLISLSTCIAEPNKVLSLLQRKMLESEDSRNVAQAARISSIARDEIPENNIKHPHVTRHC